MNFIVWQTRQVTIIRIHIVYICANFHKSIRGRNKKTRVKKMFYYIRYLRFRSQTENVDVTITNTHSHMKIH